MSKPIKPLNHFSITTTVTGVYDEEAMTALELAGRTAGKVNEAVEKVNEIGERIDGIENETIPAAVEKEFKKNLDNGSFDTMVEAHTGELTKRLDNLEGSYVEGGTTADAELFDIRVNGDGQTYPNAGAATRSTYDVAKKAIELIGSAGTNKAFTMKGTPVNVVYALASIINGETGATVKPSSGDTSYKTAQINVDEHSYYFINAKNNYGNALFAVFDAVGNLLDIKRAAEGATMSTFNGYYFTPKNAAYIVIAWYENGESYVYNGHFYKIDIITVNDDLRLLPSIVNEFNSLIDSGTGTVYMVGGDRVSASITEQHVINENGELIDVSTSTTSGYKVAHAAVIEGKLYHIHANANWGNITYAIYDAHGDVITLGDVSANVGDYTRKDGIIVAPAGAAYIRYAYNENFETGILHENIKLTPAGGTAGNSNTLAGKKWVAFGDSITEKNSRATKNYIDYIVEETGIEVVNVGVSGSGFMVSPTFGTMVAEAFRELRNSDFITFFGSFNDLSVVEEKTSSLGEYDSDDPDTFAGAVNDILDVITREAPEARIVIITPTPWDTVNPFYDINHFYVDMLIKIADRWGIPCLDLYHTSGLQPWTERGRETYYTRDDGNGVHPDENGHKIIARRVLEFLKTL